MKRLILIILLLSFPFALAEEVDNYNNFESLEIEVEVSSSIERTEGSLQYFLAKINFFPKEFASQELLSQTFSTDPDATSITEGETETTIRWEDLAEEYSYVIRTTVETENDLVKIYDKISYPETYDEDVLAYTLESSFIDITPEIESLAEEIIAGEDDVYKIVFDLAEWTQQNIAYNLTTITADAVQPSSWVLENRQGVCDELTNLFISMVRSRGIPARFVSGLVYTNTYYDFGAHGWAEVYIDGKWVPVDVTFGTFGWVDPGHVKFKDSVDSGDASVRYEWLGKNLDFETNPLEIEAQVIATHGQEPQLVDVTVEALKNEVGPGSYVPVQVTVTNPKDYYLPIKLLVTKAPELQEENTKTILLSPQEEKAVFWIAEIPTDVDPTLLYTTTVEITTMLGYSYETFIDYAETYDVVSKEEAEDIVDLLYIDDSSEYLADVDLDCTLDKELYYDTEDAIVSCNLNGAFSGAEVCIGTICQDAAAQVTWTLDLAEYQSQRLIIVAEKDNKVKTAFVDLFITEEAELNVKELTPTSLDFKTNTDLSFILESNTNVEDLNVDIKNYGTIEITELNGETTIEFKASGKNFPTGEIEFFFTYEDALGKEYEQTIVENVEIFNIPWYYQVIIWLQSLF